MFERKFTKGSDDTAEGIRSILRESLLRRVSKISPDNATVDGEFLVRNRGKVYIVAVRYIPDLNNLPPYKR